MSINTRQPEADPQEQVTYTPQSTTPPPPVNPEPTVAPTTDWRELRRQERAARRTERHGDGASWVGGAILILLGGIFLLQNTGFMRGFDNWWALFILIPAIGSFAAAWRIYQEAGSQWTPAAAGPLLGGLVLSGLAAMFLFGLDIGLWWPLFLIAGGIAILLGVRR